MKYTKIVIFNKNYENYFLVLKRMQKKVSIRNRDFFFVFYTPKNKTHKVIQI